jgi:hypothetical protein
MNARSDAKPAIEPWLEDARRHHLVVPLRAAVDGATQLRANDHSMPRHPW